MECIGLASRLNIFLKISFPNWYGLDGPNVGSFMVGGCKQNTTMLAYSPPHLQTVDILFFGDMCFKHIWTLSDPGRKCKVSLSRCCCKNIDVRRWKSGQWFGSWHKTETCGKADSSWLKNHYFANGRQNGTWARGSYQMQLHVDDYYGSIDSDQPTLMRVFWLWRIWNVSCHHLIYGNLCVCGQPGIVGYHQWKGWNWFIGSRYCQVQCKTGKKNGTGNRNPGIPLERGFVAYFTHVWNHIMTCQLGMIWTIWVFAPR